MHCSKTLEHAFAPGESRPCLPLATKCRLFSLSSPLPIKLQQVKHVRRLAFHHRDPFDRLLAAQAIEESLEIVTANKVFTRYGIKRVWG
jgi:PIN domain nuclease of toxin-antitoxin system